MSEGLLTDTIAPGMPVYGANNEPLGAVEGLDSDGILVRGHLVPRGAIARVHSGGVHLKLAAAAFAAAAPETATETRRDQLVPTARQATTTAAPSAATATDMAGDTLGERVSVPMVEERLSVQTRQMQIGEVQIEKRIVEEQTTARLVTRREEVEVIRRAPGEPREEPDDPTIVEIIRIPLRAEEPTYEVTPMVTREVVIRRDVRAEERVVTETVRTTEFTVEGHVNETYARLRPDFEAHFAALRELIGKSSGATYRARDFADVEPYYRAGFVAGSDERHAGRTYEEVEPTIVATLRPSEREPGKLEQLRGTLREGFARARGLFKR